MTEQALRQQVADIMTSWLGATRGSATHLEILRIYNNHRPLARGYTVQVGDAYCATTTSAAYIKAGIADYTGTECGCDKFIEIAQQKGIWVENDAYVPKIGDAVLYDWEDSGSGDNRGSSDHIGIVVRSGGGIFDVIEGNGSGGRVVKRVMNVNGRYIRGFICPDYAKIAAIMSGDEEDDDMKEADVKKLIEAEAQKLIDKAIKGISFPAPSKKQVLNALSDEWIETYVSLPDWAKPEVMELIELGAIKGTKPVESPEETVIKLPLSVIRACIVSLRLTKQLVGEAPREALAAELERVLDVLRDPE